MYETLSDPVLRDWSRIWRPKIWCGMHLIAWLRLLSKNRFAISWRRTPAVAIVTCLALLNTILWLIQEMLFAKAIAKTHIQDDPIFILGHWRSGTTLLHELMSRDPNLAAPTTYQCFHPNHFLLTERVIAPLLGWVIPHKRITDAMSISLQSPQEDEFAMCSMGQGSSFRTVAFPNHGPQDEEYFDLEGLPAAAVSCWKHALVKFLTQLTWRVGKRLVLKSPQHTCRVKILLTLFPDARFVYIVRDPSNTIPSTVKLWKGLYITQGLQVPRFERLTDHVLATFQRFHDTIERDRMLVRPERFITVRYEDLVADPMCQLRRIYGALDMAHFDHAAPAMQAYLDGVAHHRTGQHTVTQPLCEQIKHSCQAFMDQHGYGDQPGLKVKRHQSVRASVGL